MIIIVIIRDLILSCVKLWHLNYVSMIEKQVVCEQIWQT